MDALQPLITSAQNYFEARIDFAGQEQTEKLARAILWAFAGIGFIVGFFLQSLTVAFAIFSVGIILTLVLILPAYPAYNSHPIKWLPKISTGQTDVSKAVVQETKKDR